MIVSVEYTSVFDDAYTYTSACKYNTETMTAFDFSDVECEENHDSLTDEYITVNKKELRESDGVTFDY